MNRFCVIVQLQIEYKLDDIWSVSPEEEVVRFWRPRSKLLYGGLLMASNINKYCALIRWLHNFCWVKNGNFYLVWQNLSIEILNLLVLYRVRGSRFLYVCRSVSGHSTRRNYLFRVLVIGYILATKKGPRWTSTITIWTRWNEHR